MFSFIAEVILASVFHKIQGQKWSLIVSNEMKFGT